MVHPLYEFEQGAKSILDPVQLLFVSPMLSISGGA
jgi:hypothetical protein